MANETIKITTLIGQGSVCGGDFNCPGSARIDGTVNGNVVVEGTLILGSAGTVYGDITAKAVQIGGEVDGNIIAPDRAELTATAKVIGDLNTNVIVIDEKAIFQGNINMNQEVSEKRARNAAYRKAVRNGKKSAAVAVAEALRQVELNQSEVTDIYEEE